MRKGVEVLFDPLIYAKSLKLSNTWDGHIAQVHEKKYGMQEKEETTERETRRERLAAAVEILKVSP